MSNAHTRASQKVERSVTREPAKHLLSGGGGGARDLLVGTLLKLVINSGPFCRPLGLFIRGRATDDRCAHS